MKKSSVLMENDGLLRSVISAANLFANVVFPDDVGPVTSTTLLPDSMIFLARLRLSSLWSASVLFTSSLNSPKPISAFIS